MITSLIRDLSRQSELDVSFGRNTGAGKEPRLGDNCSMVAFPSVVVRWWLFADDYI